MDAELFLLPLAEWNALEKPQDAEFTAWLAQWAKDELPYTPEESHRHGLARYGHYLGFTAARRARERANGDRS
jgi:hypothetical protein